MQDKEILILGGGDGGLLHELLSLPLPPAHVTMVDVDEVVMEACTQFMPSVCGKYMDKDNRTGPKHTVIVGDAIEYMKNCIVSSVGWKLEIQTFLNLIRYIQSFN
jgi:spermine synthase